ncbi:hypothetical protein ACEN8I_05230 [Polaromonas sp. CT11-55]|uniref:hypothetical protein n=1 Tax=Polaromonas sp. CT11-55 TaxID=3243045 RepID=UPI0039A56814
MNANDLLRLIRGPEQQESTNPAAQNDLISWLQTQRRDGKVALYASATHGMASVLVHSVLVKTSKLAGGLRGIADWQGNPYDSPSCSLVTGGNQSAQVEMFYPWRERQPAPLIGAIQLVFARTFDARLGGRTYFELSQDLTLAHGLHWLEEKQAWCRFDENGEVVAMAGVEHAGNGDHGAAAQLVWVDHDLLQRHMSASGTSLVQMFDAIPIPSGLPTSEHPAGEEVGNFESGLIYRSGMSGAGGYARGVYLLGPDQTAQERGMAEASADDTPKEYETFTILDWKNEKVVECSSSPDAQASYFQKDSPLPFQTSPVFFRPDVLDRYKADPDKYQLSHRSITCRHAWSLQSYDVNAAGQVHTYIRYLGYLPIAEQRYWKAFNEPPKGGISERSFKTDFEGSWDVEPDNLDALKSTLNELARSNHPWFQLKQPSLIEQLHYPLTASNKIWDDTLIDMVKAVTESLVKDELKKIAVAAGAKGDPTMGSIKWLREALIAKGTDEDQAETLVKPFGELQFFRTRLAAHAGGAGAAQLRQDLLKEYGTPRQHIDSLAGRLSASLKDIPMILGAQRLR